MGGCGTLRDVIRTRILGLIEKGVRTDTSNGRLLRRRLGLIGLLGDGVIRIAGGRVRLFGTFGRTDGAGPGLACRRFLGGWCCN